MLIKNRRIPVLKMLTVGMLPSFLKVWYYRSTGAKIGKGVRISFGSIVEGRKVVIEDGVSIGIGVIIRGRKIRIGRFTEIGSTVFIDVPQIDLGEDVLIREQVFVGGNETPESILKLGNRTVIRQSSMINTTKPVLIGNDSGIGGRTLIFTHGTWQSKLEGYPCTFAPVTIGNNVWIAWNCFVLPGVDIGDGALVSAGSVVTKSIPEKSLASGNPAKVVIPSGMYPRPVTDMSEKDGLMREIIRELFEYLRFHGIRLWEELGKDHISAKIATENGTRDFLYILNEDCDLGPYLGAELDVVVSLSGIVSNLRAEFERRGCMWLDLEKKERFGSTALGEEVAVFLIRYGLKFRRLD